MHFRLDSSSLHSEKPRLQKSQRERCGHLPPVAQSALTPHATGRHPPRRRVKLPESSEGRPASQERPQPNQSHMPSPQRFEPHFLMMGRLRLIVAIEVEGVRGAEVLHELEALRRAVRRAYAREGRDGHGRNRHDGPRMRRGGRDLRLINATSSQEKSARLCL